MRADGAGLSATWTVSERADPPRYILRISRLIASVPESSPSAQMDEFIKSVSARPASETTFAVRERRELQLSGQPAGLLYTTLTEGTGEDEVAAVQGYLIIQTEDLMVPHPEMHQRNFVLVPLLDIAADWVHPILRETVEDLYWNSEDPLEVILLEEKS